MPIEIAEEAWQNGRHSAHPRDLLLEGTTCPSPVIEGGDQGGTEETGTEETGTEETGTDQGDTGEAGTEEAGTDQGGTGETGTDQGDTGETGTGETGTDQGGTEETGTGETGTDGGSDHDGTPPSTDKPSTDKPSTEEPRTEKKPELKPVVKAAESEAPKAGLLPAASTHVRVNRAAVVVLPATGAGDNLGFMGAGGALMLLVGGLTIAMGRRTARVVR
ncbi:MAG TPA: hypothetical protein VFO98_07790 [Marmoricola sp.]|nr:hypothetical protein [Marmoricola sp.]